MGLLPLPPPRRHHARTPAGASAASLAAAAKAASPHTCSATSRASASRSSRPASVRARRPATYVVPSLASVFLERTPTSTNRQQVVADNAMLARLLAWGTAWDKRVGWEAWVAWARVLQQHAAEREPFPETVMGVVNLGLVKA